MRWQTSLPLDQEEHRAKDDGHLTVVPRSRPPRVSLPPPRGHRLQKKNCAEGAQGHGSEILPAAHGPRGDWVWTRTGVGGAVAERGASPPLHRVQGVGSPEQDTVEGGRRELLLGTPQGAGAEMVLGGGGHGAVLEFLGNTRVRCREPAEMARLRVDKDRGKEDAWGSEGSEGGSGPP